MALQSTLLLGIIGMIMIWMDDLVCLLCRRLAHNAVLGLVPGSSKARGWNDNCCSVTTSSQHHCQRKDTLPLYKLQLAEASGFFLWGDWGLSDAGKHTRHPCVSGLLNTAEFVALATVCQLKRFSYSDPNTYHPPVGTWQVVAIFPTAEFRRKSHRENGFFFFCYVLRSCEKEDGGLSRLSADILLLD